MGDVKLNEKYHRGDRWKDKFSNKLLTLVNAESEKYKSTFYLLAYTDQTTKLVLLVLKVICSNHLNHWQWVLIVDIVAEMLCTINHL
jgi:hypothetical protein